jgi:hypothetical protein
VKPTGTVTFQSGTQTLGTGTLSGGTATFTTSTLPNGTSTITAVYAGDTNFTGSTSTALTQTVNTTNTGTGNTGFVTQLYIDLLGRQPDTVGLAGWVGALNTNSLTRMQVSFEFLTSLEYRVKQLNQYYATYLHRAVDPIGQVSWLNFLNQGNTLQQVVVGILGSPEYFQTRGGGTNNGWLTAVYHDVLGRTVDASGQATWTAALTQGSSLSAVAQTILGSVESDTLIIKGWYNQFLNRNPDASGGPTFLNALQNGVSWEQAQSVILGSPEFFAPFGTP